MALAVPIDPQTPIPALLAEIRRLRRTVARLQGGHRWQREYDTKIYRCRGCGNRCYFPDTVLASCTDMRAEAGHPSQPRMPKLLRGGVIAELLEGA